MFLIKVLDQPKLTVSGNHKSRQKRQKWAKVALHISKFKFFIGISLTTFDHQKFWSQKEKKVWKFVALGKRMCHFCIKYNRC